MEADWPSLFGRHRSIISAHSLIESQFRRFIEGTCPKIADAEIRSLWSPIADDSWVDFAHSPPLRVQMMPNPPHPFAGPGFNSGFPHASRVRSHVASALVGMVDELDRISPAFGYATGSISIRVFEGLRDLETQANLYAEQVDRIRREHPEFTVEEAESEASRWVSPVKNNVPVHSTGLAVDIRLWNEQSRDFLDMGTFGVIWEANRIAPTYSEQASVEQRNNRLLCLIAAERAGLTNYPFEFWHYSAGDAYARWWQMHAET